ncbi:complement receptor type 1 isoform A [Patagioenas fasciata monilis]|uniref:Complement receptor type 1 isoform A n=1 Tax=Patagioenas fasciata monilis TaxID=372326 RepID=A0A1V4KYP1_PATFA|nr:complement receptor type 1 isoform A [Patagioenas fasciata monilis]
MVLAFALRLLGSSALLLAMAAGAQEVTCPRPPNIANGLHNGQSSGKFSRGVTVYYSCKEGFELVGNASIRCSESGVWSRPLPRCEAIGCEVPEVQNGKVYKPQSTYKAGETLQFGCNVGYTTNTDESQCQPGGIWDPVLTCERVRPCPMPPGVRNGNHNGQGKAFFTMGMSVTYTCDPGYYLVGNAVVFCRASGNWSLPVPQCEVTVCVNPDIENGRQVDVRGLISAPGQTVTFQCHTGYSLQGSAQISCQEDGSWHPPVPVCERPHRDQEVPNSLKPRGIPCAPPPDIPNGKHTGRLLDEFHFGTSVTYTCNAGFPLHGEPNIHCTTRDGKTGVWSGPPPQCGAGCNAPPSLVFAEPKEPYNNQSVFPVGRTVNYVCRPGYTQQLGMPPAITCLENQTWSVALEFCKKVKCPPPPGIANGKASGQPSATHLPGSAVLYTCRDGYSLVGNGSITCTAAGTWSRPRPRCEATGCKRPEIQNGRTMGLETAYRVTDIVVFECDFGYALKGSQESQCQFGGTWNPPVPICEKMLQCPSPPKIKNGQHASKDVKVFIPGVSVRYYCDPGYVLTGKTTVSCLTSGAWSIPYPQCEVITCASPSVQNGDVAEGQSAVYPPGANVTFQCHPGFVLHGSNEAECQLGGHWAPAIPTCEPALPCPPPPVIAHATHSAELGTNFTSGMSVSYSCDPGYLLVGEAQLNCTSSGAWSAPAPRCEGRLCPSPSAIDHGQHDGEGVGLFMPGESVNYSCDPGYSLIGKTTLYCTVNGSWSIPYPWCEVVNCTNPNIQNGDVVEGQSAVYPPGANVTFQCHPGFVLRGSNEAECQLGGHWAPVVPTCEPVLLQCPSPPNIDKGNHNSQGLEVFPAGMVINYSCDPGYSLQGEASIYCTDSGNWSLPLPRCAGKQCKYPETPKNGRVVVLTDLLFGSTVSHTCEDGHRLVGHSHRRCEVFGADVAWSGALPLCQKVVCPVPRIQSGRITVLKYRYTYNDTVSFKCRKGFTLRGHRTARCQADKTWDPPVPICEQESGAWSHPPPVCQVIRCFHPPNITNGKLNGNTSNTFSYGASVSYSCDPGYSLVGNASIKCTVSGAWSRPPPRCKEIRCVFPDIQGVKKAVQGNTYRSGTKITLECDDGYTLEGISQTQCQEDSSWDPPVPACKLTSRNSGSVGLGVAAAGVLLLLGAAVVWKIISKQKEG